MGALLYFARAVNYKLLAALSAIGTQQANATEDIARAILQVLDYVATSPNNDITFRASNMVLAGHSNAAYLNTSKACS